jgi:crotonobetainyl-CoA:carnitine CoA-transferase CaiB-like acyl-CoA transferase
MTGQALFADLLVIDCASFIAGPAAGTILADFGARVIKIEPPDGDGYRKLKHLPGVPRCDSNYPWRLTNRSKESLALDLKQPEARAVLEQLLSRADVFITNYPLPVRDKLRLQYTDIRALNPKLIYASLTPYGEFGPEAGSTGYDATAWWARSGLMDSVRASSGLQSIWRHRYCTVSAPAHGAGLHGRQFAAGQRPVVQWLQCAGGPRWRQYGRAS